MVDSITEGDVNRIKNRVPANLSDSEEIEDYLSSKFDAFPDSAIDKFAEEVAEKRTPAGQARDRTLKDKTAVSGAGVTGKRTTMLRAADGTYLGKKSAVKTWTDKHGNIMGHNTQTGKRKKVADSSEVQTS